MRFAEVIPKLHALGLNDISQAITMERLDWMKELLEERKRIAELEGALEQIEGNAKTMLRQRPGDIFAGEVLLFLTRIGIAKLGTGGGE